jgi:hypothetical protein
MIWSAAWEDRTGGCFGVHQETVKKIARINSVNPDWNDLAEDWFADVSRGDPSLRSG